VALEPEHQFAQLLLAESMEITPLHSAMDSEIASLGKAVITSAIHKIATCFLDRHNGNCLYFVQQDFSSARRSHHGLPVGYTN